MLIGQCGILSMIHTPIYPDLKREKSINVASFLYGMKHTVQEFSLHHDLLGVQIFHIMEKGLFIVQMIKSKANNVCMRGQDN